MSNLYELLQKIKKSPSLYLGRYSIVSFQSFLCGYGAARREAGSPKTSENKKFSEFQEWIQKRFGIESTQSWASIILFYYEDERIALDKFFELWSEFLNREEHLEINNPSDSSSSDLRNIKLDLYELLEQIKKRPPMYLYRYSILSFFAFWSGYKIAREQFGIKPTKQHEEFEEFLGWIPERLEIQTGQSWASIVLFFSPDERSALDTFFELWSEFLNRDELSEIDNDSYFNSESTDED